MFVLVRLSNELARLIVGVAGQQPAAVDPHGLAAGRVKLRRDPVPQPVQSEGLPPDGIIAETTAVTPRRQRR